MLATRTWQNETYRVEDAHSAGMAEKGTRTSSQSIDSRQSSRSYDQGHVSRKTDQVRTSLELARSILHRLEPTCTVTTVTSAIPITETLSVEMNTVNSFQHQTQHYSQQKHFQLTAFSISILDVQHTDSELTATTIYLKQC